MIKSPLRVWDLCEHTRDYRGEVNKAYTPIQFLIAHQYAPLGAASRHQRKGVMTWPRAAGQRCLGRSIFSYNRKQNRSTIESRAMGHITIEQNVEFLKRYAYLERACMRTLAGWLPGVPEWDAKNEFGLHIWESADAADQLRGRLRELRAHQPERVPEPRVGERLQGTGLRAEHRRSDRDRVSGRSKRRCSKRTARHPDVTWEASSITRPSK